MQKKFEFTGLKHYLLMFYNIKSPTRLEIELLTVNKWEYFLIQFKVVIIFWKKLMAKVESWLIGLGRCKSILHLNHIDFKIMWPRQEMRLFTRIIFHIKPTRISKNSWFGLWKRSVMSSWSIKTWLGWV